MRRARRGLLVALGSSAVYQRQRGAVTVDLVVDLDVLDRGEGHYERGLLE
jgi:hypothetical protein